ncbi:MAG TPA: hypothetical protein VJS92_09150 [Candidatus Polarisedimenticolaceae bacterium]|nr:hypothetical protein [Candidatus Polarisedimenticolaceae bacterium]
MRRTWATIVVLVVLLAAGLPARPQVGMVPAGETPQLVLLYTGDVIGYIDPCG